MLTKKMNIKNIILGAFIGLMVLFAIQCYKKQDIRTSSEGHFEILNNNSSPIHAGAIPHRIDKTDRGIDESWANIETGNAYFKNEQYEQAAAAFQNAYDVGFSGGKAMAGFKLAEAYEKLNRKVDAIKQLERMIQNHELGELGVQDAKEMIIRLQHTADSNRTSSEVET